MKKIKNLLSISMDFRLKNTLFPQYRRIHCRIYIFCYFSPIIILNHVIHYIIYTYFISHTKKIAQTLADYYITIGHGIHISTPLFHRHGVALMKGVNSTTIFQRCRCFKPHDLMHARPIWVGLSRVSSTTVI